MNIKKINLILLLSTVLFTCNIFPMKEEEKKVQVGDEFLAQFFNFVSAKDRFAKIFPSAVNLANTKIYVPDNLDLYGEILKCTFDPILKEHLTKYKWVIVKVTKHYGELGKPWCRIIKILPEKQQPKFKEGGLYIGKVTGKPSPEERIYTRGRKPIIVSINWEGVPIPVMGYPIGDIKVKDLIPNETFVYIKMKSVKPYTVVGDIVKIIHPVQVGDKFLAQFFNFVSAKDRFAKIFPSAVNLANTKIYVPDNLDLYGEILKCTFDPVLKEHLTKYKWVIVKVTKHYGEFGKPWCRIIKILPEKQQPKFKEGGLYIGKVTGKPSPEERIYTHGGKPIIVSINWEGVPIPVMGYPTGDIKVKDLIPNETFVYIKMRKVESYKIVGDIVKIIHPQMQPWVEEGEREEYVTKEVLPRGQVETIRIQQKRLPGRPLHAPPYLLERPREE